MLEYGSGVDAVLLVVCVGAQAVVLDHTRQLEQERVQACERVSAEARHAMEQCAPGACGRCPTRLSSTVYTLHIIREHPPPALHVP